MIQKKKGNNHGQELEIVDGEQVRGFPVDQEQVDQKPLVHAMGQAEDRQRRQAVGQLQLALRHILDGDGAAQKDESKAVNKIEEYAWRILNFGHDPELAGKKFCLNGLIGQPSLSFLFAKMIINRFMAEEQW
jgi:hypothetical protein